MHAEKAEWDDIAQQTVSLEKYELLRQELNQFIYTISHDLDAPFRHIREFSKLLLQSVGDSSEDKTTLYADKLEQSVRRSEAMIDGILQLSRLNTHAQPHDYVNFNDILEQVHYTISHELKQIGATISVSELPAIKAEAFQILQLFTHLMQNAIQFRRAEEKLHIDISATKQDSGWLFSVTDNGIGVENSQKDEIFGLFKQGSEMAFAPDHATGVGLAVCEKIIEGHGGRIWVEPNQPHGSTFCFILGCEE